MRLYITALNPTDSVVEGFVPAARRLGCDVTLLTDQPAAWPALPEISIVGADVRDFRALIDVVADRGPVDAIFSNSDHLQAPTALAAEYFGLPGKSWRAALTTKNKSLLRGPYGAGHRTAVPALRRVDAVRSVRVAPTRGVEPIRYPGPFPAVVKPQLGVASENVVLVENAHELASATRSIWRRERETVLVIEEYLSGPLRTLETLGDGSTLWALGGFDTTLSPPPFFIEARHDWRPEPAPEILAALGALDVGFGAAHTEYVQTSDGPRIVEVNYRLIGDNCDLLLSELLDFPLFEQVLRVHLGEPLSGPSPSTSRHAVVVNETATHSGVIYAAPVTSLTRTQVGDVLIARRPVRQVGDQMVVTHTNRDYLEVRYGIGPTAAKVETAMSIVDNLGGWEIR